MYVPWLSCESVSHFELKPCSIDSLDDAPDGRSAFRKTTKFGVTPHKTGEAVRFPADLSARMWLAARIVQLDRKREIEAGSVDSKLAVLSDYIILPVIDPHHPGPSNGTLIYIRWSVLPSLRVTNLILGESRDLDQYSPPSASHGAHAHTSVEVFRRPGEWRTLPYWRITRHMLRALGWQWHISLVFAVNQSDKSNMLSSLQTPLFWGIESSLRLIHAITHTLATSSDRCVMKMIYPGTQASKAKARNCSMDSSESFFLSFLGGKDPT